MKRKILSFLLWIGIPILCIAGLETGTYISDLVTTNPTGSDNYATADDHIRLLKSTIKNTFPNINNAVNPTDEELNFVDGVTSAIQTQIDAKLATANLLTQILTVDGAASGIDADLLDGQSSAFYQSAANINAGTLAVARGGTGVTTSTGTGNVVLSASPTLTGTTTAATLNATTLQQGGASLTNGAFLRFARGVFTNNGSTCGTVLSQGVTSCTRTGTGVLVIDTTAAGFTASAVNCVTNAMVIGVVATPASVTQTSATMNSSLSGAATDTTISMICFGP
jgi:hypothetical protein